MLFPKTPEGIAALLLKIQRRANRTGKNYIVHRQWGRTVVKEKPARYCHPLYGQYWVVTAEKIKCKVSA